MGNKIIYLKNIAKNKHTKKEGVCMCQILEKVKNKTADELLHEYNIKPIPPIDITSLLKQLGIATVAMDFSDIEKSAELEKDSILGAALSEEEDLTIFYRKNDTYNRQLFTIAHELGHCCLHSEDLKINHLELRTYDNINSEKEYRANVFAGELLIPQSVLMQYYNKFLMPSLGVLAEIFSVSTNVMSARLDYLNLQYVKDVVLSED